MLCQHVRGVRRLWWALTMAALALLLAGLPAMQAANAAAAPGRLFASSTADVISPTPKWTAIGEAGTDQFGDSVASAGDVNKDGYADVLVGAPFYGNTGKAYLYFGGGGGIGTTPSWSKAGEASGDYFGSPVAGAGDVNGDGYGDVVVGAPGNGGGAGKAYLYLGSAGSLGTTAAWSVTGEAAGNNFGYSVASAGDVNKDGYDDVVVGAIGGHQGVGTAYLYLGSAGGLSKAAAWSAIGEASGDQFGYSVASAGDVNKDGYDDVVVGAWGNDDSSGKVYLYLGSAGGLSKTAAWSATGEAKGDRFGFSVARAGDVNKDGYEDIAVGASGNLHSTGKAYLYLGSAGGLGATPAWTATGEASGDWFGYSVAGAGDVNRDGYGDVLVGAYGSKSYTGKAYVYLGGSGGLSTAAPWTASGEAGDNYFGYSVAGAGDVTKDGYGDVLVGAYGNSEYTGKAYAYYGIRVATKNSLYLALLSK